VELAAQLNLRYVGQTEEFALRQGNSDNSVMTAAGKHIVEDFAALPDREKREVLANLLRISREIEFPEVSDEELVSSADAVFLEYDKREAGE
jgi:hypothetical protein